MKKRVMIQKRIPKYYHQDGNGIHLVCNKHYTMLVDNQRYRIEVLNEYRDFYLISVEGRYKTTVNKYANNFDIIY